MESVRLAILLLLSPLPGEEVIPKDDKGKSPSPPILDSPIGCESLRKAGPGYSWGSKTTCFSILKAFFDPKSLANKIK